MAKVYLAEVQRELTEHVREALNFLAWEELVPRDARVFFKPNLTYPSPKPGVTTTSEFIDAVLQVFSNRTSNMTVGESDGGYRGWPAEISFKSHDLPHICQRHGAQLLNLSRIPSTPVDLNLSERTVTLNLPSILLDEIDVFVTLPVPKVHQVTTISGAIKNQWGCIPDNMRLVFHPYFDEVVLEINRLLGPRISLVDGKYFLDVSGPMDGVSRHPNLIMASNNLGAIDAVICDLMGFKIENVRYLKHADNKGWIPAYNEIEFNRPPTSFDLPAFTLKLNLRNRAVRWAFDRPWAIRLIWNSWFGDILHKLIYAVLGNPIKSAAASVEKQYDHVT